MADNLKDVGGGIKQFVPEQQNLQANPAYQTLSLINLANSVGNADTERKKLETQAMTGQIEQGQKLWQILPEIAQKNVQAADLLGKQVFGKDASVERIFDLKTGKQTGFQLNAPSISDKPIYFGPQDALSPQQRFQNTQQAFEQFVKQPDNASVIEKRNALRDILNNATLALEARQKGGNPEPYEQLIASSFVRFQGPGTIQNAEFMRSIGVDSVLDQFKAGIGRLTDGKTGRLTPQGVQAFIDFAQSNMQQFDGAIQRGAAPYVNLGPQYGLDPVLFNQFVGNYKTEMNQINQRAKKAGAAMGVGPAAGPRVDPAAKPSQQIQQLINQGMWSTPKKR